MTSLSPELARWIERELGTDAAIRSSRPLGGPTGPVLVECSLASGAQSVVVRIGETSSASHTRRLLVEAAALRCAEQLGVLAPRLLAVDETGASAGTAAVVSTFLAGSSSVSVEPSSDRLVALGAAAASLCATLPTAGDSLPRRDRPLSDLDFAGERAAGPTSPMLAAADELIAGFTPEHYDPVLVHGDCWQGNTMWDGRSFRGFIDWDSAGVGQPGIDLANLRFDVAICFGTEHTDLVTTGWERAGGPSLVDLPYWDLVAATSSPFDMTPWLEVIGHVGRADLDAAVLAARRDDFIQAALRRLR